MILIGISGKKRAGKDTFCQMVSKFSAQPVHRVALADALKREIYECILKPDGLSRALLDDESTKEQFRLLLQWWGTEYRRKLFRDDYWLVQLADQIRPWEEAQAPVVCMVTDIRFPNEFEFIRSHGGLNIRIERPVADNVLSTHPSETALDSETRYDTVISNNGTLEQLEALAHSYAMTLVSGIPCERMMSVA